MYTWPDFISYIKLYGRTVRWRLHIAQMSHSAFVFHKKSLGCVLGYNILHSWEGFWIWQVSKSTQSPDFSELAPDTTVTAGDWINKNSFSISITDNNPVASVHTSILFLTHLLLHTSRVYHREGNRWKNQGGEKKHDRILMQLDLAR